MLFENSTAKWSIDANQRIKEKNFWLKKLSGIVTRSTFPYDSVDSKIIETTGGGESGAAQKKQIQFVLDDNMSQKLLKLSNNSDIRLHILLMAGLTGLLNKYIYHQDMIIGAPIVKQEGHGSFLNTVLILRSQVEGHLTFKQLLLGLSKTVAEASDHVNYPMETLLYQLGIPYSPGDLNEDFPLFDTALLIKQLHDEKDIAHITLNTTFLFSKTNSGISGELKYNSLRYQESTIRRIVDHFIRYLEIVLENPGIKQNEIDILDNKEKVRLLTGLNNAGIKFPRSMTIHQIFEEKVEQYPSQNALIHRGNKISTITYKELNEASNQLARTLRKKGLFPGGLVSMLMERSIEMIRVILGILKAGGGYLPIDPQYPAERIDYLLKDSHALHIVKDKSISLGAVNGKRLLDLGEETDRIKKEDNSNLENATKPDYPCYIIYTSGTTGMPKGAVIEHRNVVRLMVNDGNLFEFDHRDTWTLFHSYCFDFSVWEMYGALLYGGQLVIIPRIVTKDPSQFLDILKEEKVSILNQTPSAFYNLINEELRIPENNLKLRYVIFGGEALSPIKLQEWIQKYPQCKLVNMYGITETTVHVTYKEITRKEIENNSSTIGVPIPTLSMYIMNPEQQLLPIGVPGEICIGGEGVCRGYLNNLELTQEKFVSNPYKPGERIYRSGDQGKISENFEVEYTGRIDYQVKIRGYRIELGEIENHLLKYPPVKAAAVKCFERRGEKYLAAYIVPDPDKCFTVNQLLGLEDKGVMKNHQHYQLPNGMTTFFLNRSETDFMYTEIFENESYTKHGIKIKNGDCIIDVGANIGMFSLLVNQLGENLRVLAFEPMPPVFEVLKLNTSLYKGNIQVFQYGISNESGETEFTYYPNATVLSSRFADDEQEMKNVRAFMQNQPLMQKEGLDSFEEQMGELLQNRLQTQQFTCQLKTMSQVIKENQLEVIDLLKIDVEKSETDVLLGILDEDWEKIKQIVMEVHNVDNRLKEIQEILKTHGYRLVVEQDETLQDTDLYNVYAIFDDNESQTKEIPEKEKVTSSFHSWESIDGLVKDIRGFLRERLPDYMVPTYMILLEQLPMTSNGKVDRKALPEPEIKIKGNHMDPKNEIEKQVVRIWKEVLKLDRVSVTDSFFEIGGTSINVIQVITKLREMFKRSIPMVKMFEHPTIRGFSNFLKQEELQNSEEVLKNEMESFDETQDETQMMFEQTMQIMKEEENE